MAALVETQHLTKRYGERAAVDDLNLTLEEGEIFGLLGPNGAGKTTTIMMLLGLTEPSAGSATVAGFDPQREGLKVKRIVSYLPENVGFYDDMSALANLRYTAELNRIGRKDAEDLIEELGVNLASDNGRVVEIGAEPLSDELIEKLRGVKGVKAVERSQKLLLVRSEKELRPELAQAVSKAGAKLLHLRLQTVGLEQI